MLTRKNLIARNTVFYMLYQILNVFFPFITSMYVARILLPSVIGDVTSAQNIATYFSILAFLGIPTYGIREIAKVKDDEEKKSRVYSELFVINFLSTVFFLSVYLVIIFSVSKYRSDLELYLITGMTIAFNVINNEWLFSGLEEFSFIAIRSCLVKIISFVLLIIFVKEQNDYLVYAFITVFGSVGNYIINIFCSHRYAKWTWKELKIKKHMKPILVLTAVNLAIELYSLVDITMLGFFASPDDVAFYSYGSRIFKIFLQALNAVTLVVVPRLSQLFSQSDVEHFNILLRKTLLALITLSIPIVIGILLVSGDTITVIYGSVFLPSSDVLKLLSPMIIISPIGYLLGSRVLLVADKEKRMFICVAIGALVNIVGNRILIPQISYIGAAVASAISEIVIMIIYIIMSKNYYKLKAVFPDILKILIGAFIMGGCVYILKFIDLNNSFKLIVQVIVGGSVYLFFEYLLKEEIVREYSSIIKNRLLL